MFHINIILKEMESTVSVFHLLRKLNIHGLVKGIYGMRNNSKFV